MFYKNIGDNIKNILKNKVVLIIYKLFFILLFIKIIFHTDMHCNASANKDVMLFYLFINRLNFVKF
jgi:hypothetical protein